MTRPLPASVYWRRRVIVLGTTVALVLIVVNLVRGTPTPTADDAAATTAGTPTTGPLVTTTPGLPAVVPDGGSTDGPSTGGQGSGQGKHHHKNHQKNHGGGSTKKDPSPEVYVPTGPSQGPSPEVLAEPSGACEDRDVVVHPSVADTTVGGPIPIQLALRTKHAAACTWHISSHHLAVQITRGGNDVWTSSQCPAQIPESDVVVRQAVNTTVTIDWSSLRSSTGCPASSPYASPGSRYRVAASSLGGLPATSGFALTAQVVTPAPAPTPTGRAGTKKD